MPVRPSKSKSSSFVFLIVQAVHSKLNFQILTIIITRREFIEIHCYVNLPKSHRVIKLTREA